LTDGVIRLKAMPVIKARIRIRLKVGEIECRAIIAPTRPTPITRPFFVPRRSAILPLKMAIITELKK